MLRLSLGNEYLKKDDVETALKHLRKAVELDTAYSAAWKQLGRTLVTAGNNDEAAEAYKKGIKAAEDRGDLQAMKEMQVFLKRIHKTSKT